MSDAPSLNATNLRLLAEAMERYHAIKSYAEGINLASATVCVSWDTGGAIAGHRVATEKVGLLVKANLTHYMADAVIMAKNDVLMLVKANLSRHVADAVIMAKNDVLMMGRRASIRIDDAAL